MFFNNFKQCLQLLFLIEFYRIYLNLWKNVLLNQYHIFWGRWKLLQHCFCPIGKECLKNFRNGLCVIFRWCSFRTFIVAMETLFRNPTTFSIFHSSFGLPMFSLYFSFSRGSLDFLNFLKSLSLLFIPSETAISNHSWDSSLILLVLQGAISSMTVVSFWRKFE